MTFGELVRSWRVAQGLTLEVLARKLRTHKGYISGWENQKVSPPSPKMLKRLAPLMKVDLARLLKIAYAEKAPALIREEVRAKLLVG